MLLKNTGKRLITINGVVKTYTILPGDNPSVDVPDELCKSTFVTALIKANELRVDVHAIDAEPEPDATIERDELLAKAFELDMEVDENWADSTLKRKIAEAKKAQA
jgi:hypothetical protein